MLALGSARYDACAEALDFIYEHYSSEDGLPHESICDIHQDSRGYLWLCTWYGLSRYDGNGFVNYTMLPGDYSDLSHNRILSVDEDAAGYLWLMTYDYHMYRFDVGKETFTAVPGGLEGFPVSGLKTERLFCAQDGTVWLSLEGSGLIQVRPDLTYRHFFDTGGGYAGKSVTGIYEDSTGTVYVTSEIGITMINGEDVTLLSRNPDVVSFAENDGMLYFACSEHLISVDMQTREQHTADIRSYGAGEVTSMTQTGGEIWIGFKDNAVACVDKEDLSLELLKSDIGRVRNLFPDPEGLLWIVTDRTGIWSYKAKEDRFRHYEHERNVMSYYVDTLARVEHYGDRTWIKMNNYGFGYYDRCCDEIVPLSNVKNQPGCMFMNGVACFEVDRTGVMWMSTIGRGLEKITPIRPKVHKIVPPTRRGDDISSSEIRALLTDSKGNIWVAAKSRELYRYSPDLKTCRRFPDGQSGDIGVIYAILEDDHGNIWLGTKGDGLIRMTPDGDGYSWKRFRRDGRNINSLSSDNIYSIEQDHDGRIWIGTYGGSLSMLPHPDADEFVNVYNSFPDYPQETGERVRYLHCMPDGRMLVAAVGGLIIFEPSDNPELTVFTPVRKIPGDIRSLGNNDIIHIFTDRNSNTWLSTFGGGLNRLYFENGLPRFEVISTENGLSSNIVHSAIDDEDGVIWIAAPSGLSAYDPETGHVRNLSQYDGIASVSYSEAACAMTSDGSILFGTYDNVHRIVPDDFAQQETSGSLAVTGLSIDGRRAPMDGDIVIPHDCSFFRIDFSSLDFRANGNSDFSYKMEGYDKRWISGTGSNSAIYSRIPPGKYVFKVAETVTGGEDPEDFVSVNVRVEHSIWNSTYAVAFYILAGLGLILLLVRILTTTMRMRGDVRVEQRLNDVKSRFFTNVSHELRTPLTLILGGIDEIRKRTPEGDVNEYSVNIVQKNAKRMLTLVNQLLDTRSIVDGQMHLNVTQFDIVRLVQDIYDDFRDMSSERNMEMRIILSVDSLPVWGDSIRLEALVYNLLTNAFKYTSDGGKIELGVLYREGDPEYRIMVKDNGIGVDKDSQEAIFEPFIKGRSTSFSGMPSSGIGLSFCKEIADMHGGRIWVESEKGAGSKFFVRLPIDRNGNHSEINAGVSRYKVAPTCPADALKVLVIEDNAELRVYIYNSLVSKYDVRDASNGREAMDLIGSGWMPDMVVTDLMMPVMDGMALINALRSDFSTSHIPILVITAKHEDDTQVRAMKYGADGYLSKPFTMELLHARIDNMLERRKEIMARMSANQAARRNEGQGRKIDLSPEEIVITDKDEELIKKVMQWLEANVSDAEVTVDQLAAFVGMGRTSMYNKIKGLTGKSPVELIQEFRMEKATYYLKSGQYSVSETSYKVGFSDPGYFSRSFKKHFGISPADYIKQNRS